jgi:predicted helicase
MRWNLLKTFDEIYTIDLHGNTKKREIAPDGSKDENVFDIMQGVSINLFVKTGKKKIDELGKVFHHDLYGLREFKYDYLSTYSLKDVDFEEIKNIAPNYFFINKNFEEQESYEQGFCVNELFPVNSVGIVTSRDKFIIDDNEDLLISRIKDFFNLSKDDIQRKYGLKENKSWKIDHVKIKAKEFDEMHIYPISYRPFDNRCLYYDDNMVERSRAEIMKHFLNGDNLGLIVGRQSTDNYWSNVQITKHMIDNRYHFSYKGISSEFPLYLYAIDQKQGNMYEKVQRIPNLNTEIVSEFEETLHMQFVAEKTEGNVCFANNNDELQNEYKEVFAPIDILDYIYAVLHSPSYRDKYKEFLKIDFPRVPYPKNKETFWKLAKLGSEIRQIHLMESPLLNSFIKDYPFVGDGNNIVEKLEYIDGKVYINSIQYFEGVPQLAWEFFIGGYQPAQKWLKDRRGNKLEYDDIIHYKKIIVALTETERLMKEIDRMWGAL